MAKEYIERGALLADFGEPPMVWTDSEEEIQERLDWYRYKGIVESQPASDVVEVVHGKWIEADDGDGIVCSVCGADFCKMFFETEKFKGCPICLARMDGE